jgi:hypothetical protein
LQLAPAHSVVDYAARVENGLRNGVRISHQTCPLELISSPLTGADLSSLHIYPRLAGHATLAQLGERLAGVHGRLVLMHRLLD